MKGKIEERRTGGGEEGRRERERDSVVPFSVPTEKNGENTALLRALTQLHTTNAAPQNQPDTPKPTLCPKTNPVLQPCTLKPTLHPNILLALTLSKSS